MKKEITDNREQRAIADAIQSWHHDSEFTFQTSGSTGTPKPITFKKDQVKASIEQSQKAFSLTSDDKALLCLPMKYVAGKMMLFRALYLGMDVVTANPKLNLTDSYEDEVTFAAFIPLQVEGILKSEKGREWFSKIRTVLIGGGGISSALEESLRSFQNEIFHTYGMTETLTHIAIKRLSKGNDEFFHPLPNIQLSQRIDGALSIEAKHLGVRLETNDIVVFQKDQSFKILGRKDNVINSGGLKIHPEVLEATFKKYIDKDLIIKGVDDERLGQKVVLIIESEKAIDPEWINAAFSELSKAQRPKSVLYVNEFLRTESGKVIRKEV